MIDTEQVLHHVVLHDDNLFNYLKDELVFSLRQTNLFMKKGLILVNDKIIKKNINIKLGDNLNIYFEDEENEYEPQNIPLDILYESIDLLIINKPPFILVHPTKNHHDNTIANAVSNYFITSNLKRKIRFVNRLDRDTSGILVIAKNPYSHGFLAKQFETQSISKKYLTIVSGKLPQKAGEITVNINKSDDIKYEVSDIGLESKTLYKVINEGSKYSLVECELKSGRTHQIRLSLDSLGVHILGDTLYHEISDLIDRQALHAYKLSFIEPRTNTLKEITCEIPADMKKLFWHI